MTFTIIQLAVLNAYSWAHAWLIPLISGDSARETPLVCKNFHTKLTAFRSGLFVIYRH